MKNKKKLYWEIGLGFLGLLVFLWLWDVVDENYRINLIEKLNAWAELKEVSLGEGSAKAREWKDSFDLFMEKNEWKLWFGSFKTEDLLQIKRWWGMLFAFGIGFFPLTALLFRKFSDRGYIFGKMLGFVFTGWFVYVLAGLHIAKFTVTTGFVVLGLCVVVNYGLMIFLCRRKKIPVLKFLGITDGSGVITKAIWYEVLFFLVFIGVTYLKCFRPDFSCQTEGPMDYGIMLSIYKSDYMPPEDFWYSGTYLNYYYFGQYLSTFLSKMAGVTVDYGYNLALMSVATFGVLLAYGVVARVFETYMKERSEACLLKGKRSVASVPILQQVLPWFAGIVAGLGVSFSCTNHYWLYRKVGPIICDILGVDGNHSYWISDPTRYIGHQGEALDQTIHEMPAYSFILGDLHAHVLDIMNVLTLVGILFAFLLARKDRMKRAVAGELEPVVLKNEIINPNIIALSFFCGIFQMTNYWDFPIYFVVCGAVILVSNAVICGFTKKSFLLTAVHAAEFLVISYITSFVFNFHFESMANGIGICDRHTEVYQMIVVWGMPIVMIIAFLVGCIKEEQKRRAEGITPTEHKNVFFAWLQHLKVSELFILILGLCGLGLILIPELVYIKDIYGSVNQRSNTMFKLTYQAFILLALCAGMLITKWMFLPKNGKQFLGGALLLFIFSRNLKYYGDGWEMWAGDYKQPDRYVSLKSTDGIPDIRDDDLAAIDWINENIEGRPTILEAHGGSWRVDGKVGNVFCRISFMTGSSTVAGWHHHEWLWKNDVEALNVRRDDVQKIYTCFDIKKAASFLRDYGVASDGSIGTQLIKAKDARELILETFGVVVGDKITLETATAMLTMLGVDQSVYFSTDFSTSLLEKYDVDYLYVGELELLQYSDIIGAAGLDYDYFRSLGEVVFEVPGVSDYYQAILVKIDKNRIYQTNQ